MCILFSLVLFKKVINPISLYSLIWAGIAVLYEAKLVYYYDLTAYTWLITIIFQIAYNIGCILGKTSSRGYITINPYKNLAYSDEPALKKVIIVLSIVASISIITDFLIAVKEFGLNLFLYTNQLYRARLTGTIKGGIPYLGTFVFPALIFSGVYYRKYGFRNIILLPIILLIPRGLKTGGRLDFFTGAILYLVPIIVCKTKNNKRTRIIDKIKTVAAVAAIIIILAIITNNRSTWIRYNSYMSPFMVGLVNYNPAIYNVYTYLASPLGVLNEFLKEPTFNFGGHTFLTLYNFLNRIGFAIPVNKYQKFYFVPVECNVGTYIRELIEDFSIPIAIVVTLIWGFVFSYNFNRFFKSRSYVSLVWMSTFSFAVIFSFFVWSFRSSDIWLTLFVGSLAGYYLDNKKKKVSKRGER